MMLPNYVFLRVQIVRHLHPAFATECPRGVFLLRVVFRNTANPDMSTLPGKHQGAVVALLCEHRLAVAAFGSLAV